MTVPRVLAALVLAAALAAGTPWGQDAVDRLRDWQERQDERLLAQQRQLEERQRLHDDLLLERQYLRSDLQLHRERQQDERQTQRDERLNDHQRLYDDLMQDRQVEQSDRQRHRQDLLDQGLDERQQLHDELATDREREGEDLRRQREQLRDQTRRDRERTDREREQEQNRREREQQRREAEREREQQRVERERDLLQQRRRWRRDTPEAAEATDNATSNTYQGAQLWRVQVEGGDVANLQRLGDDGVAQVWHHSSAVWDLLVAADNQAHVAKLLADNGLNYTVVIPDLQRAIAEENPALSEEELELTGRKGHRMTWQHYHRAPDMHGWLDYLAKTYPDICEATVIGNSVEGRPLKVLRIKGKPGSPALWVDGGIHAREWITSASVSYAVNELVENHAAHRAWLSGVDLYVLPLANPDGYEYSHQGDRMWRKNRRRGGGCDGIDLNRNFGYKWGGKGAGPQPCQEIYRGSAPFSEPETSAIQSFVLGHKDSLKAYLSFHSYGQYVLYPWGYDRFVPPDHADLQRVGTKLGNAMRAASGLSYTVGSSSALLYPASGGSDDWAKGVAGLKYAFTVELRDTGRHGFVLPASHILSSGKEVLAAVKTLAQEVAAL